MSLLLFSPQNATGSMFFIRRDLGNEMLILNVVFIFPFRLLRSDSILWQITIIIVIIIVDRYHHHHYHNKSFFYALNSSTIEYNIQLRHRQDTFGIGKRKGGWGVGWSHVNKARISVTNLYIYITQIR